MHTNLDDLIQMANAAFAENRLKECLAYCTDALQVMPDNVPLLVLAGAAAQRSDNPSEAIDFFERATIVDKNCAPAHLWRSISLQKVDRREEALASAKSASKLNPGDPMTLHQLGQCLLENGQAEEAVMPLERAAAMAPNMAQPHLTFGLALKELKMFESAIRELRKAAKLDPQSADALIALRQILTDQVDVAGAIEVSRAILSLQPDSPEANLWMARTLLEASKGAEAEEFVAKAIALEPEESEAHCLLGWIHQTNGRLAEASHHFQRSIQLNSAQGYAYLGLVSNKKISQDDQPLVDTMASLMDDSPLSSPARRDLGYALGKAYENLELYGPAMRFYDEANLRAYQIKFGDKSFDRKEAEASLRASMDRMDREFLTQNAAAGSADPMPIFVVGMVRSGTTLVEQILSAHPKIGGAGEQSFWLDSAGSFVGRTKAIDSNLLRKFCGRYADLLRSSSPDTERAVDKMPMNYMIIGLLKVAYPNAKIIHIQRHPIDTCVSIYATPFRTRLRWAHDKANIAFNYRQYLRLMDHWRNVLEPGDFLEVRYEDLVADLETNAREMIRFCELEWDEACLRPQDNERSVATPSVWQVRQPIYRTSVDRWKRYQGMLGPIEDLAK